MALKALLCSGNAQLLECFEGHKHPRHPQNYTCLLGGMSPIHSMHWRGAQALMWGARGPFLPVAAMVGWYGARLSASKVTTINLIVKQNQPFKVKNSVQKAQMT
jgi:hypothetical protein